MKKPNYKKEECRFLKELKSGVYDGSITQLVIDGPLTKEKGEQKSVPGIQAAAHNGGRNL